jgi:hypothetical protein
MSKIHLVCVLAVLSFACTSTNDPAIGASDASADAKKGDGGGNGKGDGGGNSTDTDGGSTDTDGGPQGCTPISGGLPCDAHKIYCGASNCDGATEDCCVDTTNGTSSCAPKGTCPTDKAGLGCDEAADCAAGEVCCFTASGTTPTGSLCQTGPCGLGEFSQTCRSDAECNSGSCGTGSCGGYTIETCAPIPSTACGQ